MRYGYFFEIQKKNAPPAAREEVVGGELAGVEVVREEVV
jgi:hypothetical protein